MPPERNGSAFGRGGELGMAYRIESGDYRQALRIEGGPRDSADVLEAIMEIAEVSREADELLLKFAEAEPKVVEILRAPQSPDKHAEGPRIEDHYRTILSAVILLRDGKLPFEKAVEFLPVAGFRDQWREIEKIAQEHPNLLIAFAFLHDVAKPDTIGFLAGEGSPAVTLGFPDKAADKETEKRKTKAKDAGGDAYDAFKAEQSVRRAELAKKHEELVAAFSSENPGLDPKALQTAFFEKYKISISYRGHAEQAYDGDNLAVVERMTETLGLTDSEKAMLKFAIEQHINPLIKFTRAEPSDYEFFAQKARDAGVDPETAIRVLQSGMLVDGVLGTLKQPEEKTETKKRVDVVNVEPLTNFWLAAEAHPAWVAENKRKAELAAREKEEKDRMDAILVTAGLDRQSLIAAGIVPGIGFKELQQKIVLAVQTGLLGETPGVSEEIRAEIEKRVGSARESESK